jgi:hypothetical protein
MLNEGQNSNGRFLIRTFAIAVLVASICLNACSTVRLNSIPPLSPSAKLRVFVQVISEEPRGRWRYSNTNDEFERIMTAGVDRYLQATGVYEVISKEETQAVLGTRAPGSEQYWWVKKDYALLRQAGRALYADYAMIIIRSITLNLTLKMVLINIETGTQYTASDTVLVIHSPDLVVKRARIVLQTQYRKIFYEAKGDLLATAIRKGRLMPGGETKMPAPPETKLALVTPPAPQIAPATPGVAFEKKPAPVEEARQKTAPPVSTAQQEARAASPQPPSKPTLEHPPAVQTLPAPKPPVPEAKPALPKEPLKAKAPVEESVPQSLPAARLPDTIAKEPIRDIKKDTEAPKIIAKIAPAPQPALTAADKRKEFEKKLEHELQAETPATDKAKLVVYDFDTIERLSVVALILTDALREELFILGRFSLVNRENMMQVMQELKLQHSGLVDEKEIVELGKWLAANQAVTGRLAMLGNSYVLQAKRTDIKTMGTLGLGTLRCSSGQEEELLSGIPVLARKLIGMKSNVP